MTSKTEIQSFWQWFGSVVREFERSPADHTLIQMLDARIAQLGSFAWELGPGVSEGFALTISPGGDRELLSATKEIVKAAPTIEGWEFFFAKPPKQWEPIFIIESAGGIEVEIDARAWRYALLKYPDGLFEIIVEAGGLENLPQESQYWAAEIVLDGYLGEEKRLELIVAIDITSKLSTDFEGSASHISNIRQHIAQQIV